MPNYTILVIDYEPRSVERTRRPLASAGHTVEVAPDGVAGIEAFQRLRPDLVFVEAMLPKKGGFDVCQAIKATAAGKRTPVVITTAVYKGRKYRSQALHVYGADEYLEKPFDDAQILRLVESLVEARAPRPEPETAPDPAPPRASAPHPADDDELFRVVDSSLALEPPPERPPVARALATPPPPATSPSRGAGASRVVGDLSEDEIMARLDAILPSDGNGSTELFLDEPVAAPAPVAAPRLAPVAVEEYDAELAESIEALPELEAEPLVEAAGPVLLEPEIDEIEPIPVRYDEPGDLPEPRVEVEPPPPPAPAKPAPRPKPERAAVVPFPVASQRPVPKKGGIPVAVWGAAAAIVVAGVYLAFFHGNAAPPAQPSPSPKVAAAAILPPPDLPEPSTAPVPVPAPEASSPVREPAGEPDPKPQAAPPSVPSKPAPAPPEPVARTIPPPSPAPATSIQEWNPSPAKPEPVAQAKPKAAPLPETPLGITPVPVSIPEIGNATPDVAAVQEGDLLALNAVDTPPIAVERPAPQYTSLARTRRQEGTVVIDVLVDEHGKVIDTRLVRGIPASDLNDVAVRAVKSWTYRPAIKDGVAVKVWRPEQIRFKL